MLVHTQPCTFWEVGNGRAKGRDRQREREGGRGGGHSEDHFAGSLIHCFSQIAFASTGDRMLIGGGIALIWLRIGPTPWAHRVLL